MNQLFFDRTYFIIDCDQNNKILRFFAKEKHFGSESWLGKDISTVIIKKEDTDQNVNFYEIKNVKNKIFNIDSFETSKGMIIYVAKEINPSEKKSKVADCIYGGHRISAVVKEENIFGCQFQKSATLIQLS